MHSTSRQDDRAILARAHARGGLAVPLAYPRLSGPGWLGSAFTLGAGSLAGSLFLGVIGGYSLLWVQPLAMLLGVIMLGAISHVALSLENSPFAAISSPPLALTVFRRTFPGRAKSARASASSTRSGPFGTR